MRLALDLLRLCWFLAGPTASGKTAAGVELARRLGGEIVSLDSMSVYRQMDIGSAKPAPAERAEIPHHLLDVVDPWEEFSVAEYVSQAESACREITARGRVPLFVGGTGLYLRSLLRGVFEGPPADWELRRRLAEEAQRNPAGWLHRQLAEVDAPSASRLHPADERRIIRAIEIHTSTGRPASELQQEQPLPENQRPRNVYWLHPPRDWLYERIDRRVEAMMAAGLRDETAALLSHPKGLSRTARQGLGYREMIRHLQGECSLDDAVADIQRHSRQFAKRQHTWFRNLVECRAVDISGSETPEQVADLVLQTARQRS